MKKKMVFIFHLSWCLPVMVFLVVPHLFFVTNKIIWIIFEEFEFWIHCTLTIHVRKAACDSKQSTLGSICPAPLPEMIYTTTTAGILGQNAIVRGWSQIVSVDINTQDSLRRESQHMGWQNILKYFLTNLLDEISQNDLADNFLNCQPRAPGCVV